MPASVTVYSPSSNIDDDSVVAINTLPDFFPIFQSFFQYAAVSSKS